MNQKAVGYVRVSTQGQVVDGVSLKAQEEKLRAYCVMASLDLVVLVREEGVSDIVTLNNRPGGQVLPITQAPFTKQKISTT